MSFRIQNIKCFYQKSSRIFFYKIISIFLILNLGLGSTITTAFLSASPPQSSNSSVTEVAGDGFSDLLSSRVNILDNRLEHLENVSQPIIRELEKGNVFENMVDRNKAFLEQFLSDSEAWESAHGIENAGDELAYLTGNKELVENAGRVGGNFFSTFKALLNRLKGLRFDGNQKAQIEMKAIADQAHKKLATGNGNNLNSVQKEVKSKVDTWSKRNNPSQKDSRYVKKVVSGMEQSAATAANQPLNVRLNSALKNAGQASRRSLTTRLTIPHLAMIVSISMVSQMVTSLIKTGKFDFRGAIKMITSAEFGASIIGTTAGAAAGHFVGCFSRVMIPGLVGNLLGAILPVLGASFTGQMAAGIMGNIKVDKKALIKQAFKRIDKAHLVGSSIGSTFGAILGSMIPIPFVGTLAGSVIGGIIGGKVAKSVKSILGGRLKGLKDALFGRKTAKNPENLKQNESKTYKNKVMSWLKKGNKAKVEAFPRMKEVSIGDDESDDETNPHDRYMTAIQSYDSALESADAERVDKAFAELKEAQDEYYKSQKQNK
ncbi:hypothetical protein ACFL35_20485 [Candidatus Riflebacteria bacterium]